ncbi:hypothetical protein C8R42DRAFT_718898 [Lentinula raphanica]|nr:hypothetical protein C8R42DRAFT_718898 [Lentinula raphanica]
MLTALQVLGCVVVQGNVTVVQHRAHLQLVGYALQLVKLSHHRNRHAILTQYDEYREKRYHQVAPDDEDDDNEVDEEVRAKEQAEKRTLQQGYNGILILKKSVYPDFLQKIKEANGEHIVRELEKGAKSARSFDTSKVMNFVGEESHAHGTAVTRPNPSQAATTTVTAPPVLVLLDEFRLNTRENRGLQNDITGRLLCPVKFNWDDPVVHAAVCAFDTDYDFAISARPRCLYKDEMFDPSDPETFTARMDHRSPHVCLNRATETLNAHLEQPRTKSSVSPR